MVFVRYVLNQNTIWQTDFVTYSLVAATFIGSPYVLLTRGHVNVDVLPLYLGERARYWLALASILMSLAFCVVLIDLTVRFWHEAWEQALGLRHDVARARCGFPTARCRSGSAILALQYVADLSVAGHRARAALRHQGKTPAGDEPDHARRHRPVATLAMLLSGAPVAFGLGALSIALPGRSSRASTRCRSSRRPSTRA